MSEATVETIYLLFRIGTIEPLGGFATESEARLVGTKSGAGTYVIQQRTTTTTVTVAARQVSTFKVYDPTALRAVEAATAGVVNLIYPVDWPVSSVTRSGNDTDGNGPWTGIPGMLPFRKLVPGTAYTFTVVLSDGQSFATTLTTRAAVAPPPPPPPPTPPSSGLRDPRTGRPFTHTSPINSPIGSEANYVPAGIPTDYTDFLRGDGPNGGKRLIDWIPIPYEDEDYIVHVSDDDPLMDLVASGWKINERVVPKAPGKVDGQIRWPRDLMMPRTNKNCCVQVVYPDGTVHALQCVTRETNDPVLYYYVRLRSTHLWGDGIDGPHGGSGIGGYGLALMPEDMRPGAPIEHPLGILADMAFARKPARRAEGESWVRPARGSDRSTMSPLSATGLGAIGYGTLRSGTYMMGSRLAIPRNVDISSLGFQTEMAPRIARALQLWGGIVVDDAVRQFGLVTADVWRNGRLQRASAAFRASTGYNWMQRRNATGAGASWNADMRKIVDMLHTVTDTGPGRWGGSGEPLAQLYPPLIASPE